MGLELGLTLSLTALQVRAVVAREDGERAPLELELLEHAHLGRVRVRVRVRVRP